MSEKLFTQDGEVKREFTAAEYGQHELDQAENARLAAAAVANAQAKSKVLDKLGLTEDEVRLLLL